MNSREIKYLRPEQIRAELDRCPLAYLPLGPLEWHGPHLPLGTDPLNAEQVALRAAEQTGGLVFPTLYFGTERERGADTLDWLGFEPDKYIVGMDFPANSLPSAYASEEIFALLVREQLRLIRHLGFTRIMLVSGHGARNHMEVLKRLAAELNGETDTRVWAALAFVTGQDGIMRVGHASQIETAVMLHLYPETVALDRLPPLPEPLKNVDWAVVDYATFLGSPTPDRSIHPEDDPRLADPEDGRQTVASAAAQVAALITPYL